MKQSQVSEIQINTCEFGGKNIASELSNSGWLTVLSGTALKLYLHYIALNVDNIPLTSNNNEMKKSLGFAKGTAVTAPKELEAFGLIRCKSVYDNGSKIYELNQNLLELPSHWLSFFENNKYKKFCISALSNSVDKDMLMELAEVVEESKDLTIHKTLGKLILSIYDEIDIDMEFLLKEEYAMEDFGLSSFGDDMELSSDVTELFSAEELGYYANIEDDKRWQVNVSKADLSKKSLCGVIEHYYVHFGIPTECDVADIKAAYEICHPYQIKAAITKMSTSKDFEDKVKNFAFILSLLKKGMFGKRTPKKANQNGGFKSKEEKRQIAFKDANVSGTEMKEILDSYIGTDEKVDFDKLFNR